MWWPFTLEKLHPLPCPILSSGCLSGWFQPSRSHLLRHSDTSPPWSITALPLQLIVPRQWDTNTYFRVDLQGDKCMCVCFRVYAKGIPENESRVWACFYDGETHMTDCLLVPHSLVSPGWSAVKWTHVSAVSSLSSSVSSMMTSGSFPADAPCKRSHSH